ncbi:hypothetical protein COO60DRAFT_1530897, partial [Scenedesmus sp. NREL 46B-D3]
VLCVVMSGTLCNHISTAAFHTTITCWHERGACPLLQSASQHTPAALPVNAQHQRAKHQGSHVRWCPCRGS